MGDVVGQRLISDLGRAVVGHYVRSLQAQSGSHAESPSRDDAKLLPGELEGVPAPLEPKDQLDYSLARSWFHENSAGDVLPDPFVLNEMPNHLTPYQNWESPDRSTDCRVADGCSFPAPYILEIPGPRRGATFRYALTDESEKLARDLCAGKISARNLSDRWFRTFSQAGLFDNDLSDNNDARRAFAEHGYVSLPGLVGPAIVGALRLHYRLLMRTGNISYGDLQCPSRWGRHNEPAARILQRQLTGLVTDVVGVQVKPAYTYTVIYSGGATLLPHIDREQCEYTITVPFEMAPEPKLECPWPIQLSKAGEATSEIFQCLGEGLLFRGRQLIHSREAALPKDSVFGTLLLHYVDANFAGPLG